MSAIEAPVTGRTPGRYWRHYLESGANLIESHQFSSGG
jgi:hypothetical protein